MAQFLNVYWCRMIRRSCLTAALRIGDPFCVRKNRRLRALKWGRRATRLVWLKIDFSKRLSSIDSFCSFTSYVVSSLPWQLSFECTSILMTHDTTYIKGNKKSAVSAARQSGNFFQCFNWWSTYKRLSWLFHSGIRPRTIPTWQTFCLHLCWC